MFKKIWSSIKKHPVNAIFIALALIVLGILLAYRFAGYTQWADWTGFGKYSLTRIDSNGYVIEKELHQRTLWDLLEILVVPFAIALATNYYTKKHNEEIENRQQLQYYTKIIREFIDELELQPDLLTKQTKFFNIFLQIPNQYKNNLMNYLFRKNLNLFCASYIDNLDFSNFSWGMADFSSSKITSSNFNDCRFQHSKFNSTYFEHVNFKNSKVVYSQFIYTQLMEINFSKTLFSLVEFENVTINKSNFKYATINKSSITKSNISETNFFCTCFNNSILSSTNFSNSNFCFADLSNTDLNFTEFDNTTMMFTNLKNAKNCTPDQLSKAKSLFGAVLPNGKRHFFGKPRFTPIIDTPTTPPTDEPPPSPDPHPQNDPPAAPPPAV